MLIADTNGGIMVDERANHAKFGHQITEGAGMNYPPGALGPYLLCYRRLNRS